MGRTARYLALAAVIAFAIDQASKLAIMQGLGLTREGDVLYVFDPFLVFRYWENTGINFGLFGGGPAATRWVLVAIAAVISAGLTLWAVRKRPEIGLAAGILIGGALANAFDRVVHGAVIDFLNMSCCGIVNPYSFNLADVAIFLGAIWIAVRA